jgi:hypothetical protein
LHHLQMVAYPLNHRSRSLAAGRHRPHRLLRSHPVRLSPLRIMGGKESRFRTQYVGPPPPPPPSRRAAPLPVATCKASFLKSGNIKLSCLPMMELLLKEPPCGWQDVVGMRLPRMRMLSRHLSMLSKATMLSCLCEYSFPMLLSLKLSS